MKNENIGTEFRVGLKSLQDLYPSKIRERLVSEDKFKTWDEPHKQAIAEATRQIDQLEIANSNSNNI